MRLTSNFSDYYDNDYNEIADVPFDRTIEAGPNRLESFKILDALGFKVPSYDLIRNAYERTKEAFEEGGALNEYTDNMRFIVYLDLKSRDPKDAVQMSLTEAYEKHPDCYGTVWFNRYKNPIRRLIVIGPEQYIVEYPYTDNMCVGDVPGKIVKSAKLLLNNIKLPLFCIDTVPYMVREFWALDFHAVPKLAGTGIEELIDSKTVVRYLTNTIKEINSANCPI